MRTLLIVFSLMFCTGLYAQDQNLQYQMFDSTAFSSGITNINVYTKSGCDRCTQVISDMTQRNILFTNIIVDDDISYNAMDAKIVASLPVPGMGYVTHFPVIEINNTIYFLIGDYAQFVSSLDAFLQKQD